MPALGSQCGHWEAAWSPGSCPHSALSVVYLQVLQGWGCPGGRTEKEAEGNQLQSCLEQGAQSGCDHEKWSLAFPRQDVKRRSISWGCGERKKPGFPHWHKVLGCPKGCSLGSPKAYILTQVLRVEVSGARD